MKKVLFSVILSTSTLFAEGIPSGCYRSYNDPNNCWLPKDGVVQWTPYEDEALRNQYYGSSISVVIAHDLDATNQYLQCFSNFQLLDKLAKKRIAKMKRVCGAKCKNL